MSGSTARTAECVARATATWYRIYYLQPRKDAEEAYVGYFPDLMSAYFFAKAHGITSELINESNGNNMQEVGVIITGPGKARPLAKITVDVLDENGIIRTGTPLESEVSLETRSRVWF